MSATKARSEIAKLSVDRPPFSISVCMIGLTRIPMRGTDLRGPVDIAVPETLKSLVRRLALRLTDQHLALQTVGSFLQLRASGFLAELEYFLPRGFSVDQPYSFRHNRRG